jgi:Zn ribbon nucleic-acid-binding protein
VEAVEEEVAGVVECVSCGLDNRGYPDRRELNTVVVDQHLVVVVVPCCN